MSTKLKLFGLLAAVAIFVMAFAPAWPAAASARASAAASTPQGVHKIKHVIVIMQENRSFDTYFGTFPGADGIPGLAGNPGALPCVPDPHGGCDRPYHDRRDRNYGAPHSQSAARADMDGGKMDGFARQAEAAPNCRGQDQAGCSAANGMDVMGYHDGRDIPNYWTYARNFVLQDRMFEPVASWSLPSHLFLVSGWSALCGRTRASCINDSSLPSLRYLGLANRGQLHYRWTDLTYLLHKYHVSWRYYVDAGGQPDCANDLPSCNPRQQRSTTPGIWNPLPSFGDVHRDRQISNIQGLAHFYRAARTGHLPAVSWIVPNNKVSEHPPGLVSAGQTYVTGLVNTIMRSRQWDSTAIFLAWDDWGGFYDHVMPLKFDANGFGLRVPGLVISPYARRGYIDHQRLTFDNYNRFIEYDFLNNRAINPRTDGRPDRRPSVRETSKQLGNMMLDFNFSQPPRPPEILPVNPATDLRP
jgi:phospholipase C